MTDTGQLQTCLAKNDYPGLIKLLDGQIKNSEGNTQAQLQQLLLNRAMLLQHLGLYRKALKDYDAVLVFSPANAIAALNKAKVHIALKQMQDAQETLRELIDSASLLSELSQVLEAQQLLSDVNSEAVRPGTKPYLTTHHPAAAAAGLPPKGAAAAESASPTLDQKLKHVGVQTAASAISSKAAAAPAAPSVPCGFLGHQPQAGTATSTSSASSTSRVPPSAPLTHQAAAKAAEGEAKHQPPSSLSAGTSLRPAVPLDGLARLAANTDPNAAVSLAISQVNEGKCGEAVGLLDYLISHHSSNVGAYAARGTALALLGHIPEAIDDFSKAIELAPAHHDFYRRRAQALSVSGRDAEAITDLRTAAKLCQDAAGQADAFSDIAKIYQKQKDHRRAERELRAALERSPHDPQLLGMLGLAQVSQGDLGAGIATYDKALGLDPDNKDLVLNLGMALKEMCVVERAEKELRRAIKLSNNSGSTAVHAYRLLAHMKQGLGDHMGALKELNRALTIAEKESQKIELRFLRGACHHALGLHKLACDDYQATLECQHSGLSTEAMQFLCLAFYQKEMALYVRKQLDESVRSFCLDADIGPEFKELWCKKAPPGPDFVAHYRLAMQPQHPNWAAPKPSPPPAAQLAPLLAAADALGQLVQYSHQGFLPNVRQQRMAGLAAIEFAQALRQMMRERGGGGTLMVPNAGASVAARGADPKGAHAFGWRDAMDIIVRWRQLAEPNDQVIWVDLLTEREFNQGFGSHTPMFTGQTKCVRYYMNFDRALALMRSIVEREGRVFDADNKEVIVDTQKRLSQVAAARTAQDMWQALGTDCWVVVPISSSTRSGHSMEGTRLTMVKFGRERPLEGDGSGTPSLGLANGIAGQPPAGTAGTAGDAAGAGDAPKPSPQPDAYEFSIRTPVTPARWRDYDKELSAVCEGLFEALVAGNLPAVADQALRFAYYWYNFMPLARGSAFCGYVALLGVFLAAGAPIRAGIPKSYQTDWEAILSTSPQDFIASVSPWMLPPEVIDVLDTMRKRLEALNGPDINRV